MQTNDFERRYAQIARSLASHLCRYAHDRGEDDKRAIAYLQHELCQLWKEEQK